MTHLAITYPAPSALPDLSPVFRRLRRIFRAEPISHEDRAVAAALADLSRFEDHQLADIGLCRSDLTAEGLATAGARRARQQAQIDLETAATVARQVA
jgi:uncharacterized protein YjiS (DUF1127 family)